VKLGHAGRMAPQIVSVRGFGYKIVNTLNSSPTLSEQESIGAPLADGLVS
jgi:hypothetical protein